MPVNKKKVFTGTHPMDQQKVLNNVQKESLLVNKFLKNNFVEAELLI